ncbi:MAG: hypothetical protein WC788_02635 [Candidatus Paceibacterota bacterium]
MEKWKPIERPGPFGSKRDDQFSEWDKQYGKGNWKIAYKVGIDFLSFLEACKVYEDAYYKFLHENCGILVMLIEEAWNVYDDEESNVNSDFDYSRQETKRTHIQDIAIRNALKRLGHWFMGKKLIQIRHVAGRHPLSLLLSPGAVPFHKPELLEPPIPSEKKPWYMEGSVEDWYQRAKYLLVRE